MEGLREDIVAVRELWRGTDHAARAPGEKRTVKREKTPKIQIHKRNLPGKLTRFNIITSVTTWKFSKVH